jgi:hypothetical protein
MCNFNIQFFLCLVLLRTHMSGNTYHKNQANLRKALLADLSDVYTWSFPEFVPFCLHLFYFSSFKAFNRFLQAVPA